MSVVRKQPQRRTRTPAASARRPSSPSPPPRVAVVGALEAALKQGFTDEEVSIVERLGDEIIGTVGEKSGEVFEEIGNFIVKVQTTEDLARHCCDKVPLSELGTYKVLRRFVYDEILRGIAVPRRTEAVIDAQIISILTIVCAKRFPPSDCKAWNKRRAETSRLELSREELSLSRQELEVRRMELVADRDGWQGEMKRRLLTLFVVLICIVGFGYFVDAKTLGALSKEIEKFSKVATGCGDANGGLFCTRVYGYSLWDTVVSPTIYASAGIASSLTTVTDAVFKTLLAFVFLAVAFIVLILPQQASLFGIASFSYGGENRRLRLSSPRRTTIKRSPRKSPTLRRKTPSPSPSRRRIQ